MKEHHYHFHGAQLGESVLNPLAGWPAGRLWRPAGTSHAAAMMRRVTSKFRGTVRLLYGCGVQYGGQPSYEGSARLRTQSPNWGASSHLGEIRPLNKFKARTCLNKTSCPFILYPLPMVYTPCEPEASSNSKGRTWKQKRETRKSGEADQEATGGRTE